MTFMDSPIFRERFRDFVTWELANLLISSNSSYSTPFATRDPTFELRPYLQH